MLHWQVHKSTHHIDATAPSVLHRWVWWHSYCQIFQSTQQAPNLNQLKQDNTNLFSNKKLDTLLVLTNYQLLARQKIFTLSQLYLRTQQLFVKFISKTETYEKTKVIKQIQPTQPCLRVSDNNYTPSLSLIRIKRPQPQSAALHCTP